MDAVFPLMIYVNRRPGDPLALAELAAACEGLPLEFGQPCGDGYKSQRQELLALLWDAMGHSAGSLVQIGERLQGEGRLDEAKTLYRRALVLNDRAAPAWFGLADVREAQGKTEKALDAYERAIEFAADPALAATAHARRGRLLADAEEWAAAAADLAQAAILAPEEGRYHLDHGWYLYQAGGDLETVRAELDLALDLLPDNPWPYLRLARIASDGDDQRAALGYAQAAVAIDPALVWTWHAQGRTLRLLGRLDEAEQSLRRAVELGPDKAEPHAQLGHVLREMGRLAEAAAAYERAVELAPDNVWVQLSLAETYRAAGQHEQAVAAYRRVLALDPDNRTAQQALRDLGE